MSEHKFTEEEKRAIRSVMPPNHTEEEFQLFLHQCARTQLDPLSRQIYPVHRWNSSLKKNVMAVQTSIDGFRLIAERTGKYAGQEGPYWCGSDGKWVDVWLAKTPPSAAKVGVLRQDWGDRVCWGVARYDAYVQTTRDGKPNHFWSRMPDVMVAKCGEALALRKAFPQELSGLYTSDEIGHEDADVAPKESAAPQQSPNFIPPVEAVRKRLAEIGEPEEMLLEVLDLSDLTLMTRPQHERFEHLANVIESILTYAGDKFDDLSRSAILRLVDNPPSFFHLAASEPNRKRLGAIFKAKLKEQSETKQNGDDRKSTPPEHQETHTTEV